MKELIKIKTSINGDQLVSARDLYDFLEVSERFQNWCNRMFQYGFEESVDYVGCKVFNTLAKQDLQDYALTIDTAKEISMIQRSDKGKQARLYFIEREKQLKEIEKQKSVQHAIPQSFADALLLAAKQAKAIEEKDQKLKEQEPQVLLAKTIESSKHTILIRELAKYLRQNGVDIGQNRLYEWLRSNGFLIKSGSDYNSPTQKAMDLGLFEVTERTIVNSEKTIVSKTTKVTGKGQTYFVNKFLTLPMVMKRHESQALQRAGV